MSTTLSVKIHRYLKGLGICLLVVVLMAAMTGCEPIPRTEYNLTIGSTDGGVVTVPGEGVFTYPEGSVVALVAVPAEGYRFVGWSGDIGAVADADMATTTVNVNEHYAFTASFQQIPPGHYSLSISSSTRGSVANPGEGSFSYADGTVVDLVAVADEGYRFVDWTGDVATLADCDAALTTITMNGDCSITANFGEIPTTGAWMDKVVITTEPSPATAIQQLKNDALDIYAHFPYTGASLRTEILAEPGLTLADSFGSFREFTFNPVGPTFPETGALNPFAVPAIREAMNWLVDREYIAQEICSDLATVRYTCLNDNFLDASERYPDLLSAARTKYAHNPTKAAGVIKTEMEKLGAVSDNGRWMYNGEPVELIFLIRTEDERKEMGDYFADLLEGLGLTVIRQYGTSGELQWFWLHDDPALGAWHIYTGGWITSTVPRNEDRAFAQMYTNLWSEIGPLWEAYVNDPVFYQAAEKLWSRDYASATERRSLFEVCIRKSLEDSARIFLVNCKSFTPMPTKMRVALDLAGGSYRASMWALTAHFVDDENQPLVGGRLRVGLPVVLAGPWNPVAGMDSPSDAVAISATSDQGLQPDTRTGLRWPGRIEKAEVVVRTGLPVSVTNTEWCKLTFQSNIQVPLDAWADWDPTTKQFITVRQKFGTGGTNAGTKSVSYYPKGIFEIPLHDGSTLSMGDFILYAILQFDRGKEASAMYDESYAEQFGGFMEGVKGVRFVTDHPDYGLIVEYYSEHWELDAERMVTTMFPTYAQGPGAWHTIALGVRAEEDQVLAFSESKSSELGVEWTSFISGPSLPLLRSYLTIAKATNYIPYEPTMGLYVTQAEAAERWRNLDQWHEAREHFWVGSGPLYLERVDPEDRVVHLKRFWDYPDPMDRWLFLLEPLP